MNIRIAKIPPGFASERIRSMWVGLILPSSGREKKEDASSLRVGKENLGGYRVKVEDALRCLKQAGKEEAYTFWSGRFAPTDTLIFKPDVCEEV